MAARTSWIGKSVTRLEDPPLITGRGRFAADINFPHQLHMRVVRSSWPNAIVKSIKLRLGVPWYAYDTITFTGEVTEVDGDLITLKVVGNNSLGAHVIATSTLTLGGGK